eukprot:12240451-Alexandrium_andersonii.AAC.1
MRWHAIRHSRPFRVAGIPWDGMLFAAPFPHAPDTEGPKGELTRQPWANHWCTPMLSGSLRSSMAKYESAPELTPPEIALSSV